MSTIKNYWKKQINIFHAKDDVYSNTIKSTKKHEKTVIIFLDFANAFHIVNHEILIHTMGVRGPTPKIDNKQLG